MTTLLERAAALDSWSVQWSTEECEAWRPPERISVSEWADRNRILNRKVTAEPGPWRTSRVPYLRELQDAMQDRRVEQITFRKSTQVGGTEFLLNSIGWTVDQNPQPIVLVMPRQQDAEDIGLRRVRTMFQDSPSLRSLMTGDPADCKLRELGFKTCVLYLVGANSPPDLASKSAGVLVGDEADKWPGYSGKEASPFDLARERTRTFPGRKILIASTPITADGLISREFEKGDQRQFHVPCPHCGGFQPLVWTQVKWLEELGAQRIQEAGGAWYECRFCHERIEDFHKGKMLERGIWVPKACELVIEGGEPKVEGDQSSKHRSYQIWAGYSPWITWAQLVEEFLKGEELDGDRQNFTNSWLGEPHREVVEAPERESIAAHVRPYQRDTVPPGMGARVCTLGCDVQKGELVYALRAWGQLGESWLVRAGTTRSWETLENLIRARWGEEQLQVAVACIDSRYRTDEVVEFCRLNGDIARPIKGVETSTSSAPWTTVRVDRDPATNRPIPGGVTVYHLQVDLVRQRLVALLNGEQESGPRAFHIHADPADRYLHELHSLEKVKGRGRARDKEVWQLRAGHRRKDFFDAEVYALAAAQMGLCDNIGHSVERERRQGQRAQGQGAARPARGAQRRQPQRRDDGPSFLDVLRRPQ